MLITMSPYLLPWTPSICKAGPSTDLGQDLDCPTLPVPWRELGLSKVAVGEQVWGLTGLHIQA
jgi:hypothetical protein